MRHRFNIFADYNHFLVHDSDSHYEQLADQWTQAAVANTFVQGDDYVAVGTARPMVVPVEVRVESSEPAIGPGQYDRVVYGTLSVPTGELVVAGPTDNGASGGRVSVQPGAYRVRVLYSGLETLSADGLDGDDSYVVQLWPSGEELR